MFSEEDNLSSELVLTKKKCSDEKENKLTKKTSSDEEKSSDEPIFLEKSFIIMDGNLSSVTKIVTIDDNLVSMRKYIKMV